MLIVGYCGIHCFVQERLVFLIVMGLKLSTNNEPRMRTYSASTPGSSGGPGTTEVVARNGAQSSRARARSLGSFHPSGNSGSLSIPGASGGTHRSSSPDSESSSLGDDAAVLFGGRSFTHSLPVHLFLQGLIFSFDYIFKIPCSAGSSLQVLNSSRICAVC